ncbi:polysaccharide deacetylase family protein [Patescibacteria group bacterium]|nr:polysaccharide deacetylase family protein [Patescibacteria group bacterium]
MIFTTSWDDGYQADMRIAQLLKDNGALGTFYISPKPQQEQAMLGNEQIKALSLGQEIGAHTISHTKLSSINISEAEAEVVKSKKWLEGIIKKECKMFCYPYGDFNKEVRIAVENAGFLAARTVKDFKFDMVNRFEMPTTLHLYPFPCRRKYINWQHYLDPINPLITHWHDLNKCKIPLSARRSWQSMARSLFTYALKTDQPFFHLWGHAFELDLYNLWNDLEDFLQFVAKHPISYKTNGQLAELFPTQQ